MNLFALAIVLSALLSDASAEATFYTLLFSLSSIGSQYGITMFNSTIVVPSTSTGRGSHSAWPGLEPASESFVYQNVLIDSGPQWYFFTEYCCHPNYDYPPQRVYPGDTITSSFEQNTASGEWTNLWSKVPGVVGAAAGEAAGSTVSTDSFPNEGVLSEAIFAIELQNSAVWDFGSVEWKDIIIVANTTDTSWCSSPKLFGGFKYSISSPVATAARDSSTCHIKSLVFEGLEEPVEG